MAAKVSAVLLAAFLVTIAAARCAYSLSVNTGGQPAPAPWSLNKMQFLAWNGEQWTAWVRDDRFELDPENTGLWSRHANQSIAFIGWDGEFWQAKIEADEFLLARRGDWSGDPLRSDALRYRDWAGREQLRTVPDLKR